MCKRVTAFDGTAAVDIASFLALQNRSFVDIVPSNAGQAFFLSDGDLHFWQGLGGQVRVVVCCVCVAFRVE